MTQKGLDAGDSIQRTFSQTDIVITVLCPLEVPLTGRITHEIIV